MNKPPSQIVPDLLDEGVYLASEATMYRVLHEVGQVHARGRAQKLSMIALMAPPMIGIIAPRLGAD